MNTTDNSTEKTFNTVRIATMNILNDPKSFKGRLPHITSAINEAGAETILLQEVLQSHQDDIIEAMKSIGYTSWSFADHIEHTFNRNHGTAIFTKAPGAEFEQLKFNTTEDDANLVPTTVLRFKIQDKVFHVLSAHFSWGGGNEHRRLLQAEQTTRYAAKIRQDDPNAVIVLGGDLNITDGSDTIRYLKGLLASPANTHDFPRDLWVDAWETAGSPKDIEITSEGGSYWGEMTAKTVGIEHAYMIPPRRIDYMFSYGWAYGRPGCSMNFGRFADTITGDKTEPSDHYGIFSDFLI